MKVSYDGLGRAVAVYWTDRGGDAAPGTAGNCAGVYDATQQAADLTGDVVFEQTESRYIDAQGLLDLVTARQRTHEADDTVTGDLAALAATASTDQYVITTYSGLWYDDADRVAAAAEFGTNRCGFEFSPSAENDEPVVDQGNRPSWNTSGPELVSEIAYDDRGLVATLTDPTGQVTETAYDDLNRRIAAIENSLNFDPTADLAWDVTEGRWTVTGGLGDPDVNRVTSFVHDGVGNLVKAVAHLPGGAMGAEGAVQVTRYEYGVSGDDAPGPSAIDSFDLLRKIVYPQESAGSPSEPLRSVLFAYNRLGEAVWSRDQNGTVHELTRDDLGRVTVDHASSIPLGIDATIDAVTAAFDGYGRLRSP